ncbi:hypothetical protein A8144_09845 [Mycobacterium leprae 3125609]|nr:hypothetical protein A8144_09845 [Mycobacterium leprae 3125609]
MSYGAAASWLATLCDQAEASMPGLPPCSGVVFTSRLAGKFTTRARLTMAEFNGQIDLDICDSEPDWAPPVRSAEDTGEFAKHPLLCSGMTLVSRPGTASGAPG